MLDRDSKWTEIQIIEMAFQRWQDIHFKKYAGAKTKQL